jgi:hypothetical protein
MGFFGNFLAAMTGFKPETTKHSAVTTIIRVVFFISKPPFKFYFGLSKNKRFIFTSLQKMIGPEWRNPMDGS